VGSDFLKSFLSHIYAQVNAVMPNIDLQTVSSFYPNLSLVEKMIIDPPTEPLRTFQNAIVDREKMSMKNNKSGDTGPAGDPEEEEATVSDAVVVVGESSKSFGGKRDVVVETTKSRVVGIAGKGKGKEISSQEW
jgi:hypothetical protein